MANTAQPNILESYRKEIVQYLKDGKEHNDFFKTKDRLENIHSFLKGCGYSEEQLSEAIKQAREQFAKELQRAFESALWYGKADFNGSSITEYGIREIARNANIELVYHCPA